MYQVCYVTIVIHKQNTIIVIRHSIPNYTFTSHSNYYGVSSLL